MKLFDNIKNAALGNFTKEREQPSNFISDNDIVSDKPNADNAKILIPDDIQEFYHPDAPDMSCWILTSDGKMANTYWGENIRNTRHFNFSEGERNIEHTHNWIELGYVHSGCSHQIFSGKDYFFPRGSVWLSDLHCKHSDVLHQKELYTIFWILPVSFFNKQFIDMIEDKTVHDFIKNAVAMQIRMQQFIAFRPIVETPEIEEIFTVMAYETIHRSPGWQMILKGLVVRLFSIFLKNYNIELTNQMKIPESYSLYQLLTQYIDEHFSSVTLQQLSNIYHYSSDHIGRIILANSGVSFSQYVHTLRIHKACEMLTHSEDPVENIIAHCGYNNTSYFYKIFKENTNMTPLQYRKNMAHNASL